jgi:HJR/Mrr/RecB family endonuclease
MKRKKKKRLIFLKMSCHTQNRRNDGGLFKRFFEIAKLFQNRETFRKQTTQNAGDHGVDMNHILWLQHFC